jgi:hypothetical protein
VKHPISEVVFPLCGEWVVEAYAWSKELARQLNVSFQVLRFDIAGQENNLISVQQPLEGDGYYFAHYNDTPSKTKISHLSGEINSQLTNYLKLRTGSILVLPTTFLRSALYDNLIEIKGHTLISFPSHIKREPGTIEFNTILRQVTFHNLPFDLFRSDKFSLFSRLRQGLSLFI